MSILNLYSLTLGYSDATQNNNPGLRDVDWKRSIQGVEVQNPKNEGATVPPGAEVTVFDGTRATSVAGDTAFDLSLSPLAADLYRITHSAGTNPVLRTARALALSGTALTLTSLGNGSMTVAAGAGTPFSAVQAGDEIMITGTLTGDASTPFSSLNQGRWTVLAVNGGGASVTVARPAGQDFQGVSEIVTPTDNAQVYAYSQAGVQIGDKLKISAAFASASQKTYRVEAVTSKYVEVRSSLPLPAESAKTPGAAGFQFFTAGKRFIQVEVNQDAQLRINGSLGAELSPWTPGDPAAPGEYKHTGPVYSLSIINRSPQTLNAKIISAE